MWNEWGRCVGTEQHAVVFKQIWPLISECCSDCPTPSGMMNLQVRLFVVGGMKIEIKNLGLQSLRQHTEIPSWVASTSFAAGAHSICASDQQCGTTECHGTSICLADCPLSPWAVKKGPQ